MNIKTTLAIALALAGAGCASSTINEPAMLLDRDLARDSHVSGVTVTTGWLNSTEEFGETFSQAVAEEMSVCASGRRPLHVRVHVQGLSRAPRDAILAGADVSHRLRAVAELIDHGTVVGRYPLTVEAPAGQGLLAAFTDRQAVVSHAFAEALCDIAFHPGQAPAVEQASAP